MSYDYKVNIVITISIDKWQFYSEIKLSYKTFLEYTNKI